MDNKIDLDAIKKKFPGSSADPNFADLCMKEAIRQALVLASEKAQIILLHGSPYAEEKEYGVDKQSILNVIDLVV